MDKRQITDDRFRRWKQFLEARGATPIVCIGLVTPKNEFAVTAAEDMPDDRLADMLEGAARMIRRQMREVG